MKTRRKIPPPPDKPVRFIACDENSQTFNWQKTNKKAKHVDVELRKSFR